MKRGLTLVEVLVYVAVIAVCFLAIVSLAINIGKYNQRSINRAELDYALRFAQEQITKEVKRAGGIDWPASITDSDSGLLRLKAPIGGLDNITIVRDPQKNHLLRQGDTMNYQLTPNSVAVKAFRLTRISTSTVAIDLSAEIGSAELGPYRYAVASSTFAVGIRRICAQTPGGICP